MSKKPDPFKNFDMKNFSYIIGDMSFKLKEMTVEEFEELQNKDALNVEASNNNELSASETLSVEREWNEYVLKNCFESDLDIEKLKKQMSISKYKTMIAEVPAFLSIISDKDGAMTYMKALTENENQPESK